MSSRGKPKKKDQGGKQKGRRGGRKPAAPHQPTPAHLTQQPTSSILDATEVGEEWGPAVGNHVRKTAPGCHVAFLDEDDEWSLSRAEYDPEDFGLDASEKPPDLSLDPETRILTAINCSDTEYRCFYVTVEHPCQGRGGRRLVRGVCRDSSGAVRFPPAVQFATQLFSSSPFSSSHFFPFIFG